MLAPSVEKNTFNLLRTKNLVGIGSVPAITEGADIGSGGTADFDTDATDLSGIITIVTGTSADTGTMATITFAVAKTGKTPKIFLQPLDVNAALSQWYVANVTLTGFDLCFGFDIGDSMTAVFNYFVVQ